MGDPVGAARHVHQGLAEDGMWMIVEPMAGDHVQEIGLALGTQAGPARDGGWRASLSTAPTRMI